MAGRPLQSLVSHLRRVAAPAGPPAPPDAELLGRFAAGDQAAFELLVWRHAGLVLGVCRRVLRDEQHAEDAFQAAFLALARKAASVRRESVGGWLHRVAFRIALRARRAAAARHRRERPLGDLQPGSPRPGPCAEAAASELGAVLDEEVRRLPPKFSQALVLCCLSGKSCGEAAVELGCAAGTVESRLARARRRLRAALARRGFGAPAAVPAGLGVVTPALVSSTARAAVLFAAGGVEITPAAALAQDFLRGMVMRKVEGAVAVLVLLVSSGACLTWMGPGGPQGARAVARAPAPFPPRRPAPVKTAGEREQPEQPAGKIDQHLRAWEQQMRKIQTVQAVLDRTHKNRASGAVTKYTGRAQYVKSGTGASALNLALLEMKAAGKNDLAEKVICTGTFLYQFVPAQKEIRRYQLPPTRPGQVADDNFFTFLFGVKADEARKRYELTSSKEDRWYVYIEVRPRLAADRATFRRARLVLNRDSYLPRQLWFEDAKGNEVTWDVPRVQTGVAVDRRVFEAPKPPRGWKLVTPAR